MLLPHASIKGSKYPDEYVMVTGHLDSFDVATGGIDCGTGIGPMMEAVRMIATSGAKPTQEQAATVLAVVALGVAILNKQLSREGLYKEPEGRGE